MSAWIARVRRAWGFIARYAAHPDPRAARGNAIALLVASNQPFYPLYVYWSVSHAVAPVFLTFLSTPFFAAVPAVSRRWPLWGRALLPATGAVNVGLSAAAFGAESGVASFLLPCALIAAALFRPGERIAPFLLIALCLATFVAIQSSTISPLHVYSTEEYAAFSRINGLSAGALTVFVGLSLSRLIRD